MLIVENVYFTIHYTAVITKKTIESNKNITEFDITGTNTLIKLL